MALKSALEALRSLLAALPPELAETANEAATDVGNLVEAVKPEKTEGFFRRSADRLRAVASELAATVPAVIGAADAVILAVGRVRGWV